MVKIDYIKEPKLTFGYGQKAEDARDGLTLFGPSTYKTIREQVDIGIIGPASLRKNIFKYLKKIHGPIYSDNEFVRPFFPGLKAVYGIYINFLNIKEIDIPESDIDNFLKFDDKHLRVYNLTELYAKKLIKYYEVEEQPINVWFVIIPDQIYTFCRPESKLPATFEKIHCHVHYVPGMDSIFEDMNKILPAYDFEINFHNQLKAKLLPYRIVTQIVRNSTIAYEHIENLANKIESIKKFDAAKAWNISTTLYYKVGGLPWKLSDVREEVCYLGIVYKKTENKPDCNNACCSAQMFLDSGDGMVFRGNLGPWYNPKTKEFHIRKKDAFNLLSKSLESFREASKKNNYPNQIFIHAKTKFNNEEWEGFLEAANGKSKIIGIRIREDNKFKLYRLGSYAIPRGAVLYLNDKSAFLWTKGYIPRFKTQIGLEVPSPLSIDILRGDEKIETVCKDILALTKLNYNACIFGDGIPVTLRFADSIGEILTAKRDLNVGILPFKHYI